MTGVVAPGIYDWPVDYYHSDPCPEVSLSSSGINTLLNETPAHFAARNPRLTRWPDHLNDSTKEQDLGTVVHSLVLGKGHEIKIIDLSEFRNKDGTPAQTFNNAAAKKAKEQAEADGLIVIERQAYDQAEFVAAAATEALRQRFGTWPIGNSEMSMVWKRRTTDKESEIWCRGLADHLGEGQWSNVIVDLKTTGRGISDYDLQKKAEREAAVQAAWYSEGLAAIRPELRGRIKFYFIFVEVEPPYSVRRIALNQQWHDMAPQLIDIAVDKFADCLRADRWDSYPDDDVLDMPLRVEQAWTFKLEAARVG